MDENFEFENEEIEEIDDSMLQNLLKSGSIKTTTDNDKEDTSTEEEEVINTESTGTKQPANPESVGTEENNATEEEKPDDDTGSPIFDSIATFFKESGYFPTLTDEDYEELKEDPNGINELLEREINNRFDERQKQINEALQYRVEPTTIQQLNSYITMLERMSDDTISNEDAEAEEVRKTLIAQNYINKGIKQEKALELAENSINVGKDIKEAIEARNEMLQFYKKSWQNEINSAKKKQQDEEAKVAKDLAKMKEDILEKDGFLEELNVNKGIRQKIYDFASKVVEERNGKKITAAQKFLIDNPVDATRMFATFYVLTDGGKKTENLIKGPVKKEVNKAAQNLARVINTTSRNSDGSLNFKAGVSKESTSLLDNISNWDLADE